MGITAELAAFTAGLSLARLPPEVAARTPLLVLDLAGNIVRARHDAESTKSLLAAARALGVAAGNSAVFGDSARYTPAGAAFLNGALGHSLDFDDTHAAGSLHPGCPVIPAALAAGEMAGASGEVVLAGIVAGYEVTCRTALALPAGDHYARGFHPTATCGAFGAAAAAARVFGLDPEGVESALGIALSQSAGSLQFLANGAWTKRFQVGWASMSGLAAAVLAREGFRGAVEALEGKHGFLQAHAPSPNPARVTERLGTDWELMQTAVKPYPSCRFGHAGIDAALAFRAESGLDPARIERVTYGTSRSGMTLVGEPLAKRQDPQNVVDAQFSAPFVIAAALLTGAMNWDSYGLLHDPSIRALLPRIACEQDEDVQREFPANMSGKLTVVARGQTWQRFVKVPKGEPSNFLTDAELRAKFAGLAAPILGEDRTDGLAEAVLGLAEAPNLGTLMRLAAPTVGARLAGD
ncbi:MAG TPA: MmgE/PrpD family protein [Acetobacteraceae bacterium]|nr:MmgE/PrpD family protein [Acetobacteraceae bacterium]